MFYFYLLFFFTSIFGCHCEEPGENVEKDNLIVEIEDDDDWNIKSVLIHERNANDIIKRAIDSSEPINLDFIDGNLGVLKYKASNVRVSGINTCIVEGSKLNKDGLSAVIYVKCAHIKLVGLYEASGQIITMPIEGKGDFVVTADDYIVTVNCGLKKYEGKDGKTHYKVKNFSLRLQARGVVTYRLNNLFNGNEKLSETAHTFINNNYKTVTEITQDSIWYPCVKAVLKNTNKYLKVLPYDEIIFN